MEYNPPWWLKNGHVQSIYPSLFRKVDDQFLVRERVDTPDGDFLDLDWGRQGSRRLLIISHGLEGHSRRPYVLGMAKAAYNNNWDVLAWNFRSCSGEPNRKLESYHSGMTSDLHFLVDYASQQDYDEVALVGFSIGGNKTLLYLGRHKDELPSKLIGSVVFSVPIDLTSTSVQLAKFNNKLYMKNFLISLREKLEQKKSHYPEQVDLSGFSKIRNFRQFDDRYTAPLNGFRDALDYWQQSSSKRYIPVINRPTLLISAKDDPFLTPECFPHDMAIENEWFTLETPDYGGHVGFMAEREQEMYWSERRALDYLNKLSACA